MFLQKNKQIPYNMKKITVGMTRKGSESDIKFNDQKYNY